MPDDNFLSTFVAECAENLSTVENDLVELEREGAQADEELVNRVFRAAHSIKGGAGFLELEGVKDLAHALENVLDMIRARTLAADAEITSVLLRGFDRLGELVRAAASGAESSAPEELAALAGLVESRLPSGRKKDVSAARRFALPGSSRSLEAGCLALDLAKKAGKSIVILRFDLIHDVQRMGKTPFDILRSIESRGDVLDCAVDLESAGTLDDDALVDSLPFCVLYATALPVTRIARENELPLSGITVLELPGEGAAPSAVLASAPSTAPVAPTTVAAAAAPRAAGPRPASPPAASAAGSGPAGKAPPAATETVEESLRVPVSVLDRLMDTTSELVLARNGLMESLRGGATARAAIDAARRVDQVTRAIQEAVTLTRMQPIGNLFGRFPRLVRDLALQTGKRIGLEIEGREVEVDKTILETLSDPLMHLVRNACDHGIESPAARKAAGKAELGTVRLSARHEAGTIVVEVEDDGAGIDAGKVAAKALAMGLASADRLARMTDKERQALIFLPGLSTSAAVSEISGRGVGMDVVKTNVDKLGGQIDIASEPGKGSRFRLRLPLTLAIIPSLLVSAGGERYAIPEASVEELIRVRPGDAKTRIEPAAGGEVLVLRGEFMPLVRLDELLGGKDGARRGEGVASAVVVNSQALRYALLVDELHDTMEIVVKPLGRHFSGLREYSGATILGNGSTALILDTTGLAAKASLRAAEGAPERVAEAGEAAAGGPSAGSLGLLLFGNGPEERCAVPLEAVDRVLRLPRSSVDRVGSSRVLAYEGSALPLFALSDGLDAADALAGDGELACILFRLGRRRFGLVATPPVDSTQASVAIDASFSARGVRGSAVVGGRTVLVVDIAEFAAMMRPEWFGAAAAAEAAGISESRNANCREADGAPRAGGPSEGGRCTAIAPRRLVLVADDSPFFRERVCGLLSEAGYGLLPARDGEDALSLFEANAGSVDACVLDLEMPRLDGFELARRIRARGAKVPIVALTSLASEEDERRAREAGADSFQVKLDREELLKTLAGLLDTSEAPSPERGAADQDSEGDIV